MNKPTVVDLIRESRQFLLLMEQLGFSRLHEHDETTPRLLAAIRTLEEDIEYLGYGFGTITNLSCKKVDNAYVVSFTTGTCCSARASFKLPTGLEVEFSGRTAQLIGSWMPVEFTVRNVYNSQKLISP